MPEHDFQSTHMEDIHVAQRCSCSEQYDMEPEKRKNKNKNWKVTSDALNAELQTIILFGIATKYR